MFDGDDLVVETLTLANFEHHRCTVVSGGLDGKCEFHSPLSQSLRPERLIREPTTF